MTTDIDELDIMQSFTDYLGDHISTLYYVCEIWIFNNKSELVPNNLKEKYNRK